MHVSAYLVLGKLDYVLLGLRDFVLLMLEVSTYFGLLIGCVVCAWWFDLIDLFTWINWGIGWFDECLVLAFGVCCLYDLWGFNCYALVV